MRQLQASISIPQEFPEVELRDQAFWILDTIF